MAIISNTYLIFLNNIYRKIYLNNEKNISINAVVVSEKKENEYTNSYVVKTKDKKFILYLKKNNNNILEYGSLINIEGKYQKPQQERNYKGFNYSNYLKSQKIYGTITANKIEVLKNNKINVFLKTSNNIRNSIKNKINSLLPEENRGLLLGILIGNKEELQEETQEYFRASNLSHILAVSGMHTSFIVLRYNLHFRQKQN